MRTIAHPGFPHHRRAPLRPYGARQERGHIRVSYAFAENAFAIGACFVFGSGVLQALGTPGGEMASQAAGTPAWVQGAFLAIYGCALALLAARARQAADAIAAAPLVLILAVFPLLSIGWSASSDETLRRGVALFGTSVFGIYLGSRFTIEALTRILAVTYALIGFASLITAVAVPSIGTHTGAEWPGAWKGLLGHKNGLGATAAIGTILIIYGLPSVRGLTRLMLLAAIPVLLLLLAKAMSTTGVLTFVAMLAMLAWTRIAQIGPWVAGLAAMTGLVFVILLLLPYITGDGLGELWAQFGKSGDISGRLPIWALSWESVNQAPWLGYGYEAFWIPTTNAVKRIHQVLFFLPFYSHNGLLETLLNGGIVLVVLVSLVFLSILVRGLILLFHDRSSFPCSFPVVFTLFFALSNITESSILARNSLNWILFCALAVIVGKRIRLRVRTSHEEPAPAPRYPRPMPRRA
ncbi:O-antigen ligase family protein [Salinarimonas soli]|uniref:O-antigen ligase family protein n=1 Tax=Salinarimonas soli TaxID=1638099 RepID=A0A5B2UZ30_9HYPH|nr:O-antigen ligase family protein [Salinarimonas soli]KAA2232463.1 O-antigen ligase family protein [Salinarimonas soli]